MATFRMPCYFFMVTSVHQFTYYEAGFTLFKLTLLFTVVQIRQTVFVLQVARNLFYVKHDSNAIPYVIYDVLIALLLKIQDVMLCHSVSGSLHSGRLHCHCYHHRQAVQEEMLAWLDPEDEGTLTAAPQTTHPGTRCHIPEVLNLRCPTFFCRKLL